MIILAKCFDSIIVFFREFARAQVGSPVDNLILTCTLVKDSTLFSSLGVVST